MRIHESTLKPSQFSGRPNTSCPHFSYSSPELILMGVFVFCFFLAPMLSEAAQCQRVEMNVTA